jgi:hypothetical protein
LNKDMEKLQKNEWDRSCVNKNPFSQTKNKEEVHSSRLEQVEDRIAELDDK